MEIKNQFYLTVAENSFIDNGSGKINFKNGLVITDDGEQRNGTKYDISTMDISEFSKKLTANHSSQIESIIGKVSGIRKIANRRVVVEGIQFAIEENALARFAYNMLKNGYLTDFSIETIGPWPDEEGVYKNSKLVGLSAVVMGNNKSAAINQIVLNSIEESKELGIDTSIVENNYLCYLDKEGKSINNLKENNMKYITIKNHRGFDLTLKYTNAAGEEVEKVLAVNDSIDVSDDQKEAVEKQITDAVAPKKEDEKKTGEEGVANALKDLSSKFEDLEKKIFDNGAKAPEFKKAKSSSNSLENKSWKERHGEQINHAWNYLKGGSVDAHSKLVEINQFHLEKLQEKEIVSNAVTLADFGNFVVSPELISEIEGHRSDYQSFLSKLDWKETLSLQMSWLKRDGDVNMQEVEMCDDGANGNLKPISDYTSSINTANLHELAAVTPVCNAATRFLAADLLGDVATGYRTDYDRKRAQLAIVRLQQAVDSTGNKIVYTTDTDANALEAFINTWSHASEEIPNGLFVFSYKTYGELVRRLIGAGINGPMAGIFTTGDQPMILGRPYVVVPNDLMPALNTASTLSFTVEGVAVTINQGVFYFDPNTFTGRTSGGLQYDLSTEAAYEESGTVKSAFQRNELVLRGSFFRNGAIKDEDKVVGLSAPGVS